MTYSLLEQSLIETWLLLTTLHFKVVIIPLHRQQCGKIQTESPCHNRLPPQVRVEYQVHGISESAAGFFPSSRRNPGEFLTLPAACLPACPPAHLHTALLMPSTQKREAVYHMAEKAALESRFKPTSNTSLQALQSLERLFLHLYNGYQNSTGGQRDG